jgi:hypothetical protein
MRASQPHNRRRVLLPEGRRWGFGAHSVLPYLAMALHARSGGDADGAGAIRNPVFPEMEEKLRELTKRR